MALIRNRHVVWTSCREPHLGSGHVRPRQQAGHMIASDPIRCCRHSCKPGAVHIWVSRRLDPTYRLSLEELLAEALCPGSKLPAVRDAVVQRVTAFPRPPGQPAGEGFVVLELPR